MEQQYSLAIHGGAGTILRDHSTPELEAAYKEGLQNALHAGGQLLEKGGSAQQAVIAAVVSLEDCSLFNAGKGSVFTKEGKHEMDASIMSGKNLSAGSVAGVHTIKNPIKAAIAVMEKSSHVTLSGAGAEEFAKEKGLEIVDPSYFFTQDRWDALQRLKAKEKNKTTSTTNPPYLDEDWKFGTVGAVALD